MKWVKRILLTLVGLVVVLFAVVIRGSVVAEHSVQRLGHGGKECVFRPPSFAGQPADDPHAAGRHTSQPALKLISTEISEAEHTVTSKFLVPVPAPGVAGQQAWQSWTSRLIRSGGSLQRRGTGSGTRGDAE